MARREKHRVLDYLNSELFPGPLSEAALADMLLREYGDPKALITHCPTGAPAVRIFKYQTLWGTWPELLVKDGCFGN
jgi:hypothetical protein